MVLCSAPCVLKLTPLNRVFNVQSATDGLYQCAVCNEWAISMYSLQRVGYINVQSATDGLYQCAVCNGWSIPMCSLQRMGYINVQSATDGLYQYAVCNGWAISMCSLQLMAYIKETLCQSLYPRNQENFNLGKVKSTRMCPRDLQHRPAIVRKVLTQITFTAQLRTFK